MATNVVSHKKNITNQKFDYTPTLLSTVNNVVDKCFWIRDGKFMVIYAMISWTGAGATGSPFTVSLPAGYEFDTDWLVGGTSTTNQKASVLGHVQYWNAGGAWYAAQAIYSSSTAMQFHTGGATLLGTTFTTGYSLQIPGIRCPISGWE